MGRPKLLLPFGATTVLGAAVHALRQGGVRQILIVSAPHGAALEGEVRAAGCEFLVLPEPTPDMQATVQLAWISRNWSPREADCWFLAPADHPMLDSAVVSRLLQVKQGDAQHSIWIPTFAGKRGHPTLFTWPHARAICELPANSGIHSYIRARTQEACDAPVETDSVLFDLDTPQDYERLLRLSSAAGSHGMGK
jgi:molybdenum cofactor cytidylyltransferase